jgi:hypothetical protein
MSSNFRPIAQIASEFRFEASHQLRREDGSNAENNAVFGNCARLHGPPAGWLPPSIGQSTADERMCQPPLTG